MKRYFGFLLLLIFYKAYPNSIPTPIALKAFEIIKPVAKVYIFCAECGDIKAKILHINKKGMEPVSDGNGGYGYNFFVNENVSLNILNVYYFNNGKWVNLGLASGIKQSNTSLELKPDQLPYDIEVEAESDFKTPSELNPLTVFEKKILEEINLLRIAPPEYSKSLEKRIPFFENNIYKPLDRKARLTREGVKGIENAIKYLANSVSLPPLLFSPEITNAIQSHFKNKVQYSSRWREIRERYGNYLKDAELINIMEGEFYGYNIASDLVAYILSNEGQFKKSIIDNEMNYIGLACTTDSSYGYKCHITLTSGLAPENNVAKMQEERFKKSSLPFLSEFEKKVIEETNLLRTKPKEYAEFLKERRKFYFGKIYKEPYRSPVNIKEGISALEEAISYLEKVKPIHSLEIKEELCLSSNDHVKDTGEKGIVGHYGTDGSSPKTRILNRKKETKRLGENIDYGWVDPRDVVISLFVDDGVSDRGHRKNLFNRDFIFIGVSCGFHRDYPLICVQNFGTW